METYVSGWIDGGVIGNPGVGVSAFILDTGNSNVVHKTIAHDKKVTNNEAEYYALIHLLKYCVENKIDNVLVNTDSQLVANQINGIYKVRSESIRELYNEATDLMSKLKNVKVRYVPRENNREADRLVGKALKRNKRR